MARKGIGGSGFGNQTVEYGSSVVLLKRPRVIHCPDPLPVIPERKTFRTSKNSQVSGDDPFIHSLGVRGLGFLRFNRLSQIPHVL